VKCNNATFTSLINGDSVTQYKARVLGLGRATAATTMEQSFGTAGTTNVGGGMRTTSFRCSPA